MHLIGWLSLCHLVLFFSVALIYSFIWAIFSYLGAPLKGRSFRYLPGQGHPLCSVVVLRSEREQCCLLSSQLTVSHFSCYPQANWALLVLIPGWVVCVHSMTLWVSPANSPVRLIASPTAATPTGF